MLIVFVKIQNVSNIVLWKIKLRLPEATTHVMVRQLQNGIGKKVTELRKSFAHAGGSNRFNSKEIK